MCLSKPALDVKLLSHSGWSHLKGFSPSCTWRTLGSDGLYEFHHTWVRCLLFMVGCSKILPHTSQIESVRTSRPSNSNVVSASRRCHISWGRNRFWVLRASSCTTMWFIMSLRSQNALLQMGQECGFSWECVLWCRQRFWGLAKFAPHSGTSQT